MSISYEYGEQLKETIRKIRHAASKVTDLSLISPNYQFFVEYYGALSVTYADTEEQLIPAMKIELESFCDCTGKIKGAKGHISIEEAVEEIMTWGILRLNSGQTILSVQETGVGMHYWFGYVPVYFPVRKEETYSKTAVDMKMVRKAEAAAKVIQRQYLQARYNPRFKLCRDILSKQLTEVYSSN